MASQTKSEQYIGSEAYSATFTPTFPPIPPLLYFFWVFEGKVQYYLSLRLPFTTFAHC